MSNSRGSVTGSGEPSSTTGPSQQEMRKKTFSEIGQKDSLQNITYSKIRNIIKKPNVKEDDLQNFGRTVLPFLIQSVKMWNGYVLNAHKIASLVTRSELSGGPSLRTVRNSSFFMPRLDIVTYLINEADCIVVEDIFRILSKFPIAIPLIIQDIHDDEKYIVTYPSLQNIIIKWEPEPGQIVENHLFSSPFKMVAALRLGENKIGKSTILNQLMRKQHMFSSRGEPGGRYCRPSTLDGSVEIVWLTQETCSDNTWAEKMYDFYREGKEEIAILANLHGDALRHVETVKYLEQLACSFIVFLMPNYSEGQLNELKQTISGKPFLCVLVDENEDFLKESDILVLKTDSLLSDDTQEILRHILKYSLEGHLDKHPVQVQEHNLSLRYSESLKSEKAEEFIFMAKNRGCVSLKKLLTEVDILNHKTWNQIEKDLIHLSICIYSLPQIEAYTSILYLETQLSRLSAMESRPARHEVNEANEKLRRLVKIYRKAPQEDTMQSKHIETEIQEAKENLKTALDKVDSMNVGQEHIFRTLGCLYENSTKVSDLGELSSIRRLPDHLADLLMSGHAIELLNGDTGKIQLIWIKAICKSVIKKVPNLKVFVVSIIGLQSSGKSTLLNALFSCRFAVSVGRCSRGLFMRMIFLEDDLRQTLGFDAVILMDSEGLSSAEKLTDPKACQKDRLMATFAMGISDLTIVNILGEGMREMTEILQIAIVAMARLRSGKIKPDILIVQHLQERNDSRTAHAKSQFCEAINEAFKLVTKCGVEIGSASAECLAELTMRVQSGDIFKHFGSFKDGSGVNSSPSESYHLDVVDLYQIILSRTMELKPKNTFERWSHHFESYWECVQNESFALNFKNIKHITDFLYFDKKIASTKEILDCAIRYHREILMNEIREKVSTLLTGKEGFRTEVVQSQILDDMKERLDKFPFKCPDGCDKCKLFVTSHEALIKEANDTEFIEDIIHMLQKYNEVLHENTMKILKQTFVGSVVKQGCFSIFSDVIEKELKVALQKNPSGIFKKDEQMEIIRKLWQTLINTASKETAPSLDKRLDEALFQEYIKTAILPSILDDMKQKITFGKLLEMKSIKSDCRNSHGNTYGLGYSPEKLTAEQLYRLTGMLNDLLTNVFKSRRFDYSQVGLDFEAGMIREIKSEFKTTIEKYEELCRITLLDRFKIDLQVFLFQTFKEKMQELQKLWDSQNSPYEILMQKRNDYLKEIVTRLKSGFSSAGEGKIVAMKLIRTMREKAFQAGSSGKVESIKELEWTSDTEKVRLRYFEQLALEVAAGQKIRALYHFRNPKDSIEQWYKSQVDTLYSESKIRERYVSTLREELERILQNIEVTTCKEGIEKVVQQYTKNVDDHYYSKIDPKEFDFRAFKNALVFKLKQVEFSDDIKNIRFPLASADPEIYGRLGCTEYCFWCGALCWGSRDHKLPGKECSAMEAHHSCHQPRGLKRVRDIHTNRLRAVACHNVPDTNCVWFNEFHDVVGILWSEAKKTQFKDWKFDAHCITKFDEMMRWFFQELHEDIAKVYGGCLPADEAELVEHKCKGLVLEDILQVVRSKI